MLSSVKKQVRGAQGWLERHVLGTRLQSLIWRTRHLYKPGWAEGYLATTGHPHRQQLVDAIARFEPDSILEVGCGPGANLVCLHERLPAARLSGIDLNPAAIAAARNHFALNTTAGDQVVLKVAAADKLSGFADNSVDVVFSDAVLMFIAPDLIGPVLGEMLRVARRAVILNEYHLDGASDGHFDGGRWIYDLVARSEALAPHARITRAKSAFTGGAWDDYGSLIEVSL